MARLRVFALASLAFAFVASPARLAFSSPQDVFGFGPRTMALGGSGAAMGRGFEAVWGNPALLSASRERELSLGFLGAVYDLRAPTRLNYGPLAGGFIGAVLPVPFAGSLADRVTIGLGFFTPFDLIVRGRILYPETPKFLLADRTASVAVQVALGIDVGHGFRVGGGFAALAALSGSVLVATDQSGRIGTVVEDTLVASYAALAGASYERGPFRLGLTFRGELAARFNVVINVQDLGQIVVPPLNISGLAQYDPMQLALEFGRVKGPWKWTAGATWKHWSAYPGPAESTVRCPPPDPVNGEVSCSATPPAPVDFADTVVPRIGAERVFSPQEGVSMALRAGYFLELSPAPEQTQKGNLFDNTRSVFGIGYGLELSAPLPHLRLDLAAQAQLLHPQTHHKDADVLPENPGAPTIKSSGVVYAGAATVGVGF